MCKKISECEKKLYSYSALWTYLVFLIYGHLHFLITKPEIAFVEGNSNFKINFFILCLHLLICRFLYSLTAQYIGFNNKYLKICTTFVVAGILLEIITLPIYMALYPIPLNKYLGHYVSFAFLWHFISNIILYVLTFVLLDKYHTKFFRETTEEKRRETQSMIYTFLIFAVVCGLISVLAVVPKWDFWHDAYGSYDLCATFLYKFILLDSHFMDSV